LAVWAWDVLAVAGVLVIVMGVHLMSPAARAASAESITRTNQPALVVTTNGPVEYLQPAQAPIPARLHQVINFNEALRTLIDGRATVRFYDWSGLRLADRSSLLIVRDSADTNSPAIRLLEGQLFFSSRGGPIRIPIETPHGRALTKGTEFLVRVDAQAGRSEFIMFDGQLELSNEVDQRTVLAGQQGVAIPGRNIEVRPLLEATNVVQWWLYYPAVLDPAELGLTGLEQMQLAHSLTNYQAGDLTAALRSFPGYPASPEAASERARLYYAALLLSVGAVERARTQMSEVDPQAPLARALRTMSAAVAPPLSQTADATAASIPPESSSEFLALSYAHQATNDLKQALHAAGAAVANSPDFAFGWERIAELEFSFGHIRAARKAIERSLTLAPRNAQAHALNGFLLAAENKPRAALAAFDQAISIDPGLGNAWLGRGLCKRRISWSTGFPVRRAGDVSSARSVDARHQASTPPLPVPDSEADWLSDLQTAAIIEPRRALFRSYLGKAFADVADFERADHELAFAQRLDPNDPTSWLYRALLKREENRVNDAVDELEKSIDLNDQRALYRSRFLLDEDRAVRSSSLANLYQSAGLNDVAVREAARAVSYDYANYSAHQFLAEGYNALRDPTRFNLRYETVWFNELLLADLLSPVGGTPLSQHISQQEYARLFEGNRVGLSSDTLYRSDGQYRELASQFGRIGNTGWSLDLDYQHNNGVRPNNELDRIEWYTTIKQNLTPQDSVLLLAKYQDYHSGDNFQYYDPRSASKDFTFDEIQDPILLAGYHREWSPGVHTLLLGGRLINDQSFADRNATNVVIFKDINDVPQAMVPLGFDVSHHSELEIYTAELSQLLQTEHHTLVLGVRLQTGEFQSRSMLTNPVPIPFPNLAADTRSEDSFGEVAAYGYYTVELPAQLHVTGGLAYQQMHFPENFRSPPIHDGETTRQQVSPKAALVWNFVPEATLRGIYTRSLGGVSLDESYRLEPVQLAGFSQAFRTLIPESLAGSVAAPEHETWGGALDVKLGRRTYLGVQGEVYRSTVRRTVGVFEDQPATGPVPSSTPQHLDFEEQSISARMDQLLGAEWSAGLLYRFSAAELKSAFPDLAQLPNNPSRTDRAELQEASVNVRYNHPSGVFAIAQAAYYWQHNAKDSAALADEAFPQVNLSVGYRFPRQRGEVSVGGLNLNGADYHLNPVNLHPEYPRERVFVARLLFNF
jgi:Tfp pilus assembly protein PilF